MKLTVKHIPLLYLFALLAGTFFFIPAIFVNRFTTAPALWMQAGISIGIIGYVLLTKERIPLPPKGFYPLNNDMGNLSYMAKSWECRFNNITSMRSLKKVQFIFVFCVANILILASSTKYSEERKTNLYEYGTVVTSEDNLKNLFKNFPIFIENGKEIDFLSYQFIGTIRNKKRCKKVCSKKF